jgi:radical SAM superfamily enzyme YgiQ (UPF0313 family)
MKALLVWPKFESFSFWNFEKVCELTGVKYMTPPLGLLTVAALLPSDWELRLVDENVGKLEDSDLAWADIVFVGSKIVHRQRALEVIRLAKAKGLVVVAGGPDVTLNPKVYSAADHVCTGEGEVTVPLLLADLQAGKAQPIYRCDRLPELSESPVPRFDLIDFSDYLYLGVQYSRGCPHHCEFCNVIDLFSNKFRTKSVTQVLSEFDYLYRLGYRGQLDFFDDNLVGNIPSAKALLTAIAEWLEAHGHPFLLSTSVTLNIAKDSELLALLRRARFKYFLVGIETPDEAALRTAQKPQNTGFSISEATDRIYREAGATIHSGFLLGLDGESPDIADQIIRCIDEATIPWVMAGVVYPLPGTQLAKRLEREKRLFPAARDGVANAPDQISAGLQFKPQRPAIEILDDLLRVLDHSFDAAKYFERCASVALRLNTIPKLIPGARIFFRNARTFVRLCWKMLRSKAARGPFFKTLLRVVLKNPAGIEALATLSVLYVHFEALLPYCHEKLAEQRLEVLSLGEERWLERHLAEPTPTASSERLAASA